MPTRRRFCTFNVRLDTDADGDDAWPHRRALVVDTIRSIDPGVLGLQEPFPEQLAYLKDALPEYQWYGVPRKGGGDGEHSAVAWRVDRFDPVVCETRWLSEQPGVPSVGWDAAYYRTATRVRLLDRETGDTFTVWNTHLDNEGVTARRESARLLSEWTTGDDRQATGEEPVVLMGDFNAPPGSEPYGILTGEGSATLRDARDRASEPVGPDGTIHHFTGDPEEHIDHVFVSPGIDVERHRVVTESDDGRYPSDHFPVVADLVC
jgi:endonuclease/exonuclease/phosphatase family metal-dependent hydrolase